MEIETISTIGDGGLVVGDGRFWSVIEVQRHLDTAGVPASDTTVRRYITMGWLRAWFTGGGHARIEPVSVDELVPLLKIQDHAERRAALAALARRNRGEPDPMPGASATADHPKG